MSKMYDELKAAELHLTNACGCENKCADCLLRISAGLCVLTALQQAITAEFFRDLRRQHGEAI